MSAYTRPPGRLRRTLRTAAPALAFATVLLTACGGEDGGAANAAGTASGGTGRDTQAYRECLGAHGITLPSGNPGGDPGTNPSGDPGGGPGGVQGASPGAPGAAPDGAPPGGDRVRPTGAPSFPDGQRPAARPSGAPSGRPGGGAPGARATDPAFAEAEKACASLRPQRDGAGRGTAATGPGTAGGAGTGATTGTGGAGTGGTATGEGGGESAIAAFTSCLKDRQVELPAGGVAALNRADPAVTAALTVCEPLLPSAAG